MKEEHHSMPDGDEDPLLSEHELTNTRRQHVVQSKQSWVPTIITIFSIAASVLSLMAVVLLYILLQRQQQNHHHGKVGLNDTETVMHWKDCGNSSTEARAKGCLFDVLLTTWIHADCYDSQLHESYLAKHDFPWWRKPEMEDPITLDEVRRGDYNEIYTNLDYHFVHCGYAWEMILRAFRRGKAIEGELWAMAHTTHCVHNMVDRPSMPLDRTILNVGFETCGKPYY
ncbi:hypothetical protein MMC21_006281 [Puttea exsequens]|nr:hypothetical protein [Puttea exsequens]